MTEQERIEFLEKEDRQRAKRKKDAAKRDKFYKDRSSKIIKNL